jgi:hypothetical protein
VVVASCQAQAVTAPRYQKTAEPGHETNLKVLAESLGEHSSSTSIKPGEDFALMSSSALLPVSEEIREWCSILEKEMKRWPGVTVSHLFGTLAFHHRKVMFAMLPDKRSVDGFSAISFRAPANGREGRDGDWQTFEIKEPELVNDAILLLDKAYKECVLHPF